MQRHSVRSIVGRGCVRPVAGRCDVECRGNTHRDWLHFGHAGGSTIPAIHSYLSNDMGFSSVFSSIENLPTAAIDADVAQHFAEPNDRTDRRTQLMTYVSDEVLLNPIHFN